MYDNDLNNSKNFFFVWHQMRNHWSDETIYSTDGYIAEPHGQCGYLGLKKKNYKMQVNALCIFLKLPTQTVFRYGGTNIERKATNSTQIESVLGKQKKWA
jgi:threonine synthase